MLLIFLTFWGCGHKENFISKIKRLEFTENISSDSLKSILDSYQAIEFLLIDKNPNLDFDRIILQLSKYEQVDTLFIEQCGLVRISDKIGQLKGLKYLSLFANSLDNLPESLGNLKELRSLNLCYNPLGERELDKLFQNLGPGSVLTDLGLCHGGTIIPASISHLKRLETLIVTGHYMKQLPHSISELEALKSLSITNGPLQQLPHHIGKLKNLEELRLQNNQLSRLPRSMMTLTNLQFLNIEHNKFEKKPWLPKLPKENFLYEGNEFAE